VDLLAAWLVLAPEERGEAAGARALAALAVGAEAGLSEGALARLASQGGWDAGGSPAVDVLLGALADAGRPPALRRGILTLAGTRRIRALRPGVAPLAGEPGPLRAAALDALAQLDGGLPAAQLRELLAGADPALRAVAVRQAGAALGVAELAEVARTDPDATVRAAAVGALAARGGAEALEGASAGLFDADPGVRNEAILALGARGAEGVPLCQRLASERRAPEAGAPVAALALAGPAGRNALAEIALRHPDPKVRDLASLALGRPLPEH
jgi:HEAT repeat protein